MGGGYGPGMGQFGQGPGMGMGMGGGMGMGMGSGFGASGMIRLPGEVTVPAQNQTATTTPPTTDQTGQLLGETTPAAGTTGHGIRIVADPVNNLIVVQGTQQEWEVIERTLQQLDFAPRQVLIQAKVYEVTLNGALSSGVQAFLARRGGANTLPERKLLGGFTNSGVVNLTLGALVGNTRELALFLNASQSDGRTRVISAPSLIATDNIAASITVGQSVPTLASQALAGGAQAEGSSLFTNTISNVQTGVTLGLTARVNASGIVTMEINQEVSSPQPPGSGDAIQSPSIDRRNVRTQITVNDGDTVAIAGIIQETDLFSRNRVPGLGKIPIVGGLFGGTSSSKIRTELVVLLTPRVIYDETEFVSASEELKSGLRSLRKIMP
jgi:general secretion pathway protein D